nr:hypothetical protein [Tanacetum cinerariifolium]
MNMGQDRQMQMVGGNGENQFRQNQNGLIGVPENANMNGNGNLVAARAEGNAAGHNGNQIRCYNYRRMADLDEIKEVNANCILMANLQQASTSGTQTDKAPVYDSDRSAEVHDYAKCYDNEIFNMFTQDEQYIKLLEPIPEPHQVPQNDNSIIFEDSSVEQSGEIVVQHPVNFEETCALYDSLYHNLAIEVEKVNSVNRKLKETNADLTTELVADKFVGDFKSLAKEADESLAKHKALELEIERLLRAVVSQDIMSVVQKESVVDTSNLQTKLERIDNTKTRKPQPRSNTKNDRVPSTSKSSRSKNKGGEVEEHHRNLLDTT